MSSFVQILIPLLSQLNQALLHQIQAQNKCMDLKQNAQKDRFAIRLWVFAQKSFQAN